ncbi:methyltransferase [Spongiactinospora rosea]|uniref:Methyltransferase n=1 Tax=Spongiactinospora rosea TaxID=2248750 RepID=A0A366LTL3_9ACTN|nr:thiopeptide-type bacteriocin biosynthesis protein [Spongiactinospora rosea]RBQ16940.1 methyltransferase [Spongiactinospora rosea]
MGTSSWHQVNLTFPDWNHAEQSAATDLAPILAAACTDELIASWFFVRKSPCWRLRYLSQTKTATPYLRSRLATLQRRGIIVGASEVTYEPEQRAFGGVEAMRHAHALFHADSRYFLAHLTADPATAHRRELAIMLCGVLLRAAGLDWYEQGDVWARVAEHRDLPDTVPSGARCALEADVRRLMSATGSRCATPGWFDAFAAAGQDLAALAAGGRLRRGLRDVLTHHVIFAWNRHGLPAYVQAALAHRAAAIVFGPSLASGAAP